MAEEVCGAHEASQDSEDCNDGRNDDATGLLPSEALDKRGWVLLSGREGVLVYALKWVLGDDDTLSLVELE